MLRTAEPLGLRSVIVDDGWQMADAQRTYGFCGDWEVCPEKIRDMKTHVSRIHAMGLKYFLWYSVPYVGIHSKAWERFKGKYFPVSHDTAVLDPRYPDVREYLIQTYENAVINWDLDGFKLDFIDQFSQPAKENSDAPEGRDYVSTAQAVDRLMTDIISRLKALKPDIGIEFRQSYIGPLMRKYGNMFRAADCANDTVINKLRTIDIRLLSGNSPAHSDMLTWSPEEIPGKRLRFSSYIRCFPYSRYPFVRTDYLYLSKKRSPSGSPSGRDTAKPFFLASFAPISRSCSIP